MTIRSTLLVFDTETTGLPDFRSPSEAPHQPHITQLAAQLFDADNPTTILGSINMMIQPDGWTIPEELERLTGITTDLARKHGVPLVHALSSFVALWQSCDLRIAHNEGFDARMVRIELFRTHPGHEGLHELWKAGAAFCTANNSTKILNLPPTAKMVAAGFNKPKMPNLGEAYRHFTGKELVGAHNASTDIMACKVVYAGILAHQSAKTCEKATS